VNVADALTKHVDAKAMAIHSSGIKLEFRAGRHAEAPEMTETVQEVNWGEDEEAGVESLQE